MKKNKIIASAFLAGAIFVGSGYAWWSDSLSVNSTVNTGAMKVEFVDTKQAPLNLTFPGAKGLELGSKYLNPKIVTKDSKTTEVTVDGIYPGSGVLYAVKFQNNGTIPAKIDNIEVNFRTPNSLLEKSLITIGGYIQWDKNNNIKDGDIFPGFLDQVTGRKIKLADLSNNLNSMLKGKVLEPGDYITLDIPEKYKNAVSDVLLEEDIKGFDPTQDNCIIMGLSGNKSGNELKNQKAVFDIKLNFKQVNQK